MYSRAFVAESDQSLDVGPSLCIFRKTETKHNYLHESASTLFLTSYILSAVLMALCQGWSSPRSVYSDDCNIRKAAIVIRVWYLFARNRLVRTIAVSTFAAAVVASIAIVNFAIKDIKSLLMSTTVIPVSATLLWIFVPSLIIHTVLFALKVYRFSQSSRSLHVEAPLRRFLKESTIHVFPFEPSFLIFLGAGECYCMRS